MVLSTVNLWTAVGGLVGAQIGYGNGKFVFSDNDDAGKPVPKTIVYAARATFAIIYGATGALTFSFYDRVFSAVTGVEKGCTLTQAAIGVAAVAGTYLGVRYFSSSEA